MRPEKLLIGLLVLALAGAAGADVVRLKDGRTFEGTVVTQTPRELTMVVEKYGAQAIMKFARTDIAGVYMGKMLADMPAPPLDPSKAAPLPDTPGASPAGRQPNNYEALEAMIRFLDENPLPDAPNRPTDFRAFDPLVNENDQALLTHRFGQRIAGGLRPRENMTAAAKRDLDRRRLALVEDLHAAAMESDTPPGARRLMYKSAFDVLGMIDTDVSRLQERLRSDFVRTLEMNNPNHRMALFAWDVAAWQYTGRVDQALAEQRMQRLTDGGVQVLRWLIHYGQTAEAATIATNMTDAYASTGSMLPEKARLAVWALAGRMVLARRVNEDYARLKRDPRDRAAHLRLALNLACYARDPDTAHDHLRRLEPAGPVKTLAEAGRIPNARNALPTMARGLAELADADPSARPDEFAAPMPLWRASMWLANASGDRALAARMSGLLNSAQAGVTVLGVNSGPDVRHVVFVIDRSSSMAPHLASAKAAVAAAINAMPQGVRFQAVAFGDAAADSGVGGGALLWPTGNNKRAAAGWVSAVTAAGGDGSNVAAGVELAMKVGGGPPDVVFVLGDGGFAASAVERVKSANPQMHARIHTVAFGAGEGAERLRQIAADSGGEHRVAGR